MVTRESQKRASHNWYEKNKDHVYNNTIKWRENNLDIWRIKANEYSKKCSQRKRDFQKEFKRLASIMM